MSTRDTASDIEGLVARLSGQDMVERLEARRALVEIGPSAVPAVEKLAESRDPHARWECAKTLSQIAEPSSVDTLIRLLEDAQEGTRWDAALGLIAVGKPAVAPLLQAVIHRSVDYTILPGARHVIHEFSRTPWGEFLRPVYEALNSFVPREAGPVEAGKALQKWEFGDVSK